MTDAIISHLPAALWIIPVTAAIFAALIWYALSQKDHVSALFRHGKTMFRIEARGRHASPLSSNPVRGRRPAGTTAVPAEMAHKSASGRIHG
jgi:hypothetical protein